MDVSLIPIGAYNPRWIMRSVHTNPAEAVQIHQDVRSRFSIACHWGTFRLTDEPLNEPPALLKLELAKRGFTENDFRALSPGESVVS
jgi:N-acyl-phosphatidylethanolamine-hydrolysing phospholipase D